jgi:hypothetical protein
MARIDDPVGEIREHSKKEIRAMEFSWILSSSALLVIKIEIEL